MDMDEEEDDAGAGEDDNDCGGGDILKQYILTCLRNCALCCSPWT